METPGPGGFPVELYQSFLIPVIRRTNTNPAQVLQRGIIALSVSFYQPSVIFILNSGKNETKA